MIAVIGYGSGNVKAIQNIYKRLNIDCIVAETPSQLAKATHMVLPGVGAFDTTLGLLEKSGMREALDHHVKVDKVPILGICVGMQIMAEASEEGKAQGLGWVKGHVRRLKIDSIAYKPYLPHLGWNSIETSQSHALFTGVEPSQGFYFLHSYFFDCVEPEATLATTEYGDRFTVSVHNENVFGVQFHPEKSHHNGIQVFKNFASF